MKLKIANYNVSGGFYEENDSVDFFDKEKAEKTDNKLLNELIRIINEENIDVICFQEIITTKEINYINDIVNNTNLKFEKHFELSPCHLVENTNCGIAILSKYPIEDSIMNMFTNPKLSKTTSSGNVYYTFDKGFLMVSLNTDDSLIKIMTHHNFPFRRFNSTPEENKGVFEEFDNIIKTLKPNIVTGDFNSENFIDMMTYTNDSYKKTINEVTTVDNRKFDNILINKALNFNAKIVKSLSDHYMVITEVEI